MQTTILLTLSIVFALCAADCSVFTPTNISSPYLITTLPFDTVSATVNCTGSNLGVKASYQQCNATQCGVYVPDNYQIKFYSQLNVSTTSLQPLLTLIRKNTTFPHLDGRYANFNASVIGKVGVVSSCLESGQEGFLAFTPDVACVDGVVSGCSGSTSALEGVGIKACGYMMLNNGYLSGNITTKYVSNVTQALVPANATSSAGLRSVGELLGKPSERILAGALLFGSLLW